MSGPSAKSTDALHQVLELADVAGPGVAEEQLQRLVLDALDLLAEPLVVLLDEVAHEERDVARAARAAAGSAMGTTASR